MALIVEDGTGRPDAESYGGLAQFLSYASSIADNRWEDTDFDVVEAGLRRGTAAIDLLYADRWPGQRTNGREQALNWPRVNVIDSYGEDIPSNIVPREVVTATFEATRRELATPGAMFPEFIPSEVERRVQIGPIAVEYADRSGMALVVSAIDHILSPLLLEGRTGTRWLERV